MLPDIQLATDWTVAEKANGSGDDGRKQSIQGRATVGPFGDMIPGFGFFGDTMMVSLGQVADEVPQWSIYPQYRDAWLRKFYLNSDGALSSAMFTMQSKLGSLAYKIDAPGPRAKKHFSDLLGNSNFGEGFPSLLKLTSTDLNSQDNGWFWELIGAGRADRPLRGPVLQIAHLDSACCWRTFDPEFPVLYVNPYTGEYHKIHESRIVMGSSFPQPHELARGIGYCAVSRALRWAQYARDIIVYKHEKASGRFKRAIGYGSGFTNKQFDQAVQQADEKNDAIGYTRYSEIPFLLTMKDKPVLDLLNLAALPDGFDSLTEQNLWVYCLAFAFGVDAREFWPATASGATKADASIQNMKAQGKGFAEDVKSIEHAINWKIFPDGTSLEFDNKDDEQDKKVADLHAVHVWNVNTMLQAGVINPLEGRAILISEGVINPDVLKDVQAPILADDSAPVDLESDQTVNDQNQPDNTNTTTPTNNPAQPATLVNKTGVGGNRGGPNINPVKSPVSGSKEDAPVASEIKGKPLPEKQAIAVDAYTPDEIEKMYQLYNKLSKGIN